MRGLPFDTDRNDLTWGEVCGFMEMFVLSREVIATTVRPAKILDPGVDVHSPEVVGYLTGGDLRKHEPAGRYYFLDWPEPGTHVGLLSLVRDAFVKSRLSTVDGCTYFTLWLTVGGLTYEIRDTNTTEWTDVPEKYWKSHATRRSIPARAGWTDESEVRHGLPHDTQRTDISPSEAFGYLAALTICDEPVFIAVADNENASHDIEATGYLTGGGFVDDDYSQRVFYIDWPARRSRPKAPGTLQMASFAVPVTQSNASLLTQHGNATFDLRIDTEPRSIRIANSRLPKHSP